MSPYILTLDLSLRATGWAVGPVLDRPPPSSPLEGGNPFELIEASGTFFPPGESRGARAANLHDWLIPLIVGHMPSAICIEQVFVGQRISAAKSQIACETVVEMLAHRHALAVREVAQATLKKFAVGEQGKAGKTAMREAVERHRKVRDDNEADAIWVAVYFQTKWAGKLR